MAALELTRRESTIAAVAFILVTITEGANVLYSWITWRADICGDDVYEFVNYVL